MPVDGMDKALSNLAAGVRRRERRALAKAITLIESTRPDHRRSAQTLLAALMPHTGGAVRLGVSGVPGAGKSTFIEALGMHLIERGKALAVLAIDPSSTVSGGSILGDKTRMERLSQQEAAFIRPSPSRGSLGGVAQMTRETMLICEAAGFDVVIVETVGVGQSEAAVAGMTDVFALLQLPNTGDELQAIKRGIVERADLIAINKADIDPAAAHRARGQWLHALALLRPEESMPPVLLLAALKGEGVVEFWQAVERCLAHARAQGRFEDRRREQALAWMWELVERGLMHRLRTCPAVQQALPETERSVAVGRMTAAQGAERLFDLMASAEALPGASGPCAGRGAAISADI